MPPRGGLARLARLLLVATPFLSALISPATLEAQKETGRNRAPVINIEASSTIANVCPGRGSAARVQLKAAVDGVVCKARYRWNVTGGRIVGEGPEVVWDLSGTPVDDSGDRPSRNWYDATVTVESGPGCDVRRTVSIPRRVVVWNCPPGLDLGMRTTLPAPQSARCPNITVCCHATVNHGLLGPFVVTSLSGGAPGVKPTFDWTLHDGEVVSGRGTKEIFIDMKGVKGRTVLATVEVGGYGSRCSATCRAELPPDLDEPDRRRARLATLSVSVKSTFDGRPVPHAKINVYHDGGAVGGPVETDVRGQFTRGRADAVARLERRHRFIKAEEAARPAPVQV